VEPREHHVTVTRTARYWVLGEPGPAVRDVWFVAHGHGQLARYFLRGFAAIAAPERLVVAPEALNRFYLESSGAHGPDARVGATWMTREDRLAEIADYVRYLDTLHDHVRERLPHAAPARDAVRVTALGFSQGVATVSRWACRGRARLDRLILWAGPVAAEIGSEADRAALARLEVVRVFGADDPIATAVALSEEEARWRTIGVATRVIRFAGGHHLDDGVLRSLAV
jgi:predicted esterase